MSIQSQEDALMRLKGKADEFQKHAARLAEVARQSAAISADARSKLYSTVTDTVTIIILLAFIVNFIIEQHSPHCQLG